MKGFNRGSQSRLPIILAASIGVFGVMIIAIALASLKKSGEVAQADSDKRDRVVVVEKEAPVETIDVLVPVQEIEQGKKLEPQMFRVDKRPKVSVGQGAIRSFEEIKNQYSRSIIPANSPLSREFMTTIKPANRVISSIPAGSRAVTISVDALSAVEGWATPGALVDVQWIADIEGKRQAKIIVYNARVLSAERQVEGDPQQQQQGAPIPTTVTLVVTERDAQRISLASMTAGARLMLLLRGANDAGKGSASDGPLTLKDLTDSPSSEKDYDGILRLKNPDGTVKEITIKSGKLQASR